MCHWKNQKGIRFSNQARIFSYFMTQRHITSLKIPSSNITWNLQAGDKLKAMKSLLNSNDTVPSLGEWVNEATKYWTTPHWESGQVEALFVPKNHLKMSVGIKCQLPEWIRFLFCYTNQWMELWCVRDLSRFFHYIAGRVSNLYTENQLSISYLLYR